MFTQRIIPNLQYHLYTFFFRLLVRLAKLWPPVEEGEARTGRTFTVQEAFADAGLDTSHLPGRVQWEQMPLICAYYGLEWLPPGRHDIGVGEPVIVLYEAQEGQMRAECVGDLGKHQFLHHAAGLKIVGIVRGFDVASI
ncbi:MAG: hypothetical protein L0332_30365 [Chloroflexi bacterium]|nr:hypothetical protein [Chloroflexota bacterium]